MTDHLLLAANDWIGSALTMIILVISILSYIISAIKGNNPQKPAGGPAAPQKPRNELEQFLKQVLEANRPKPAQPQPAERPRTNPNVGRNKLKNKQKRPPMRPAEPVFVDEDRPAPPGSVANRHLQPSSLGSGVKSHLRSHLEEDRREDEAARQRMSGSKHLGERVRNAVSADLGGGLAASAQPATADPASTHPMLAWLSQPGAVQNAIIIQEILQKPRVLRRG